jgi:hypothetical protein
MSAQRRSRAWNYLFHDRPVRQQAMQARRPSSAPPSHAASISASDLLQRAAYLFRAPGRGTPLPDVGATADINDAAKTAVEYLCSRLPQGVGEVLPHGQLTSPAASQSLARPAYLLTPVAEPATTHHGNSAAVPARSETPVAPGLKATMYPLSATPWPPAPPCTVGAAPRGPWELTPSQACASLRQTR